MRETNDCNAHLPQFLVTLGGKRKLAQSLEQNEKQKARALDAMCVPTD
jgi:hypothetical protein